MCGSYDDGSAGEGKGSRAEPQNTSPFQTTGGGLGPQRSKAPQTKALTGTRFRSTCPHRSFAFLKCQKVTCLGLQEPRTRGIILG